MPEPTLDYRTPPSRSRVDHAAIALLLALVSFPFQLLACSGTFVALGSMAFAVMALTKSQQDDRYGGKSLAIVSLFLSSLSVLLAMAAIIYVLIGRR